MARRPAPDALASYIAWSQEIVTSSSVRARSLGDRTRVTPVETGVGEGAGRRALRTRAEAFGDAIDRRHVDGAHDEDELVAAVAPEAVALGHDLARRGRREVLEHEIPDMVSVRVVDALEIVEVEQHDRKGRAAPRVGGDGGHREALEGSAVERPRERVVRRGQHKLLIGLLLRKEDDARVRKQHVDELDDVEDHLRLRRREDRHVLPVPQRFQHPRYERGEKQEDEDADRHAHLRVPRLSEEDLHRVGHEEGGYQREDDDPLARRRAR